MSTVEGKERDGRFFFRAFGRKQVWLEVSGYQVGDIDVDQPVWVATGSTLVGDVIAPQVRVSGLLTGTIVTQETIVEAGGHVWGDVYTIRLQIEPGGKVHGWISTISEEEYETRRRGEPMAGEAPEESATGEEGEQELAPRDREVLDALHLLQKETAVALAARAELEQSFDQRLSELAGEALARAASLDEALEATREELARLQPQLARLEEKVQTSDEHIASQAKELAVARELLVKRQQELEQLQETSTRQRQTIKQLQAAKRESETSLESAQEEIEQLQERLHNLETALQASLQHTSELEDSLMRWQELAEITDARVRELEAQLGGERGDNG